jgi:hypothetical protein
MQFHIFIIELQYQYLNYITGIPVLYKILKKIHNAGTNFYTSDRQVQEIQNKDCVSVSIINFIKLITSILNAFRVGL